MVVTKCDNNICHTNQYKKVWLKISAKMTSKSNFGIQIHPKIINHNILHTPFNVSVMLRKTPGEAMSVGLAKACDLRENLFC